MAKGGGSTKTVSANNASASRKVTAQVRSFLKVGL